MQKHFGSLSRPLGLGIFSLCFHEPRHTPPSGKMYAQAGEPRLTYDSQPPADVGNFWIQQKCSDNAIYHRLMKVGQRLLLSLCFFLGSSLYFHSLIACVGRVKPLCKFAEGSKRVFL